MSAAPTSKRGLARALGVALSSLQARIAAGSVTWPPASVEAARAEWLASTNRQGPAPLADRSAPPSEDLEGESLADARRRKESALADLREVELAAKRGELVERARVIGGWSDMICAAKTSLLTIPSRLREAGLPLDAAELAERIIRESLEHLAGDGVPR